MVTKKYNLTFRKSLNLISAGGGERYGLELKKIIFRFY